MEIKVELFASPFLSFHSSSSSGVICYSVASHKLLWEHHSWDDYLDRSHSAEWLQSIFVSLKSTYCFGHSVLVLQAADDFTDVFALIALCDQTFGWQGCTRYTVTSSTGGWKIKSDGIMMKRATLLTQLWKVELEGTNCWQLFGVLDCLYFMRISSVTAKLPTC